jgi:hypothetical protein
MEALELEVSLQTQLGVEIRGRPSSETTIFREGRPML